jgi:hypothetical protein
MSIEKRFERQMTTLTRLCKLSELGKCQKWFRPKVPWQEFCKYEHQQEYHKILRREKKALAQKVMEHEKRLKELEKRSLRIEKKLGITK